MKFTTLPRSGPCMFLRRSFRLQAVIVSLLTPGLTFWSIPIQANPSGGVVVNGDVTFSGGAGNLQINQASQRAIIDWADFSIDAGELTQFNQPGAAAAVLNRVTGGNPSAIHGALKANGNVFVINPNGILIGANGVIDVHGLALSTLDVSNGEFLAGGDMVFKGDSGDITNMGRINAIGGDVFLIGRTVTNSGTITARSGTVGIGAGEEILLKADNGSGNERVFVRSKGSGVSGTGILNDGTIEGASVELKAHGNMYALAINNKGSIRATGATTRGGSVFLRGPGGGVSNSGSIRATAPSVGSGGRVLIEAAYARVDGMIRAERGRVKMMASNTAELEGTIDVSSSTSSGGLVEIEAREISLSSTARVDVSGFSGGGTAKIGGGYQGQDSTIDNAEVVSVEKGARITANSLNSRDAGTVIFWSDYDTLFAGDIEARAFGSTGNGGMAEVSGKASLGYAGSTDLTSENGDAGTLLLDPTDVIIEWTGGAAVAGVMDSDALANDLDLGTNVNVVTNTGGADAGNISVRSNVEWYQETALTVPGTLGLFAQGNILFADDVRSAGTGGINIVAGWDGGDTDIAAILATLNDGDAGNDRAGLNGGSVFINGYTIEGLATDGTGDRGPTGEFAPNLREGVEVGSRFGATQVAAHDVLLRGKDGSNSGSNGDRYWAQLGFRDTGVEYDLGLTSNRERNEWWGDAAGNAQGKDYITMLGGSHVTSDPLGTGAFLGAGHGATGDIVVQASGRIDIRGGNDGHSYAQIGHGGSGSEGLETARNSHGTGTSGVTTRDGFVMSPGDNNRTRFGTSWRTNYIADGTIALSNGDLIGAKVDADITIGAGEDFFMMAPQNMETAAGFTDLVDDQGSSSRWVKVGHGGQDNYGSYHGDITVIADGATDGTEGRGVAGAGIQVRGGRGSLNIAQIGHGGFHEGNRRTIYDQTSSGDIVVSATTGAVRALGFNLLPREGDDNTGTLVDVNTQLQDTGSGSENQFSNVQIGHGGWHRDDPAGGGIFTSTGPAIIGAGQPNQNIHGDITVFAGGTVDVADNMGYDDAGVWHADLGAGHDPYNIPAGELVATRKVGVEVRAGNADTSYGMIGHGGANMRADDDRTADGFVAGISGDIQVDAENGAILMIGGEEKRSERNFGYGERSFVQIGHGGHDVRTENDGVQGSVTVNAGQGSGAVDGDVIVRTGRANIAYGMIGHGGDTNQFLVTGDGLSDIVVNARDHIEFTSRISMPTDALALSAAFTEKNRSNNNNYGGEVNTNTASNDQFGHIGDTIDADTHPEGNTRGSTYNVDQRFVQLGHGGYNFVSNNQADLTFSTNNTIDVAAGTGGVGAIRFTAGDSLRSFAMLGMGGWDDSGDNNITGADITVTSQGDIYFDASSGGVGESNKVFGGTNTGSTNYVWARGQEAFAMIGNGGYEVDGDHNGDITVTVGNGGNLYMIGPNGGNVPISITNYVGATIEGPTANADPGLTGFQYGTPHTYTALQEATMKQRSFFLYHGTGGLADGAGFSGPITPGSIRIDSSSSSGSDDVIDDGAGNLIINGGGFNGFANGDIVGTIDYATGEMTIYDRIEGNDEAFARDIDYSYDNGGTIVAINNEHTAESDAALRANRAYLGHGGIVAGSVSIVIDADDNGNGRQVIRDIFGNGTLYDESSLVVGSVSYDTGRLIFNGINTATSDTNANGELNGGIGTELRPPLNDRLNPDEVVAHYEYTEGNADRAFVQLGNGGYGSADGGRNSEGSYGEIKVTVDGDIRFHGGTFDNAYAQLGHGGRSNQSFHGYQFDPGSGMETDVALLDATPDGNITVEAGGIVEFLSGRGFGYHDNEQYSQLGHGGLDADGHHQGNIRVTAGKGFLSSAPGMIGDTAIEGGLVFTAGQGRDSYTQLGHGGYGARSSRENNDPGVRGLTGLIDVGAEGDILFTSGTLLANRYDFDDGRIYSQLGHGGYDADVRSNGGTDLRGSGVGHNGDITVISTGGSIRFQAGDHQVNAPGSSTGLGTGFGILHYTHLGHGGYGAVGDHSGNITVTAENDISFSGGANTYDDSADKRNYALLGNGGDESEGYNGKRDVNDDPLEEINVTANTGDISFVAGAGRRNWVQLGNGGYENDGDSVADINVSAGGDILFLGGQGPEVFEVRGESGMSVDRSTFGFSNGQASGWTPLRRKDIRVGERVFTITVDGKDYVADGSSFIEADGDGAFTTAQIYESGTGALDVDGKRLGANVVGEIDLRNGEVRFTQDIDPNNTVAFGTEYNVSGWGTPDSNNRADNDATINPQLALALKGNVGNTIQLFAYHNDTLGGVTGSSESDLAPFASNIGIASGTFKMNVPNGTVIVDNGGALEVQTVGAGSSLTVGQSVGSINYITGGVTMTEVVNPDGQVGGTVDYDMDRPIGADLAYAQLGNGGYGAEHDGANDDKSLVGDITLAAGGDVRFHAGNGQAAYTQLGHGGYGPNGAHSGDITISTDGAVEFLAGLGLDETDAQAYAQLGHGGRDSDGNHFGDITIQGLNGSGGSGLASSGPTGLANIGNVAGSNIGVHFKAGDRVENYVQLGHGGYASKTGGGGTGTGTDADAYGLNGDITIATGGDVNFIAGTGSLDDPAEADQSANEDFRIYALLGHGGYESDPIGDNEFVNLTSATSADDAGTEGVGEGIWGHFGDITITSFNGNVNVMGGSTDAVAGDAAGILSSHGDNQGRFLAAQIGHGGILTGGNHFGDITVYSGFDASGAINDTTTSVNLRAGNGVDNSGDEYHAAKIGHGGIVGGNWTYERGVGNLSGNIDVRAGSSVNATGGVSTQANSQNQNYTQIGHGAYEFNGDFSGNINVQAGDGATGGAGGINFTGGGNTGGSGSYTYALLGHGGAQARGDHGQRDVDGDGVEDGDITVISGTGGVNFSGGYHQVAFAQLGHGGNDSDITATALGNQGDITVTTLGDIRFLAGSDDYTYVQLGHGGRSNQGTHTGDITVTADGGIAFVASNNVAVSNREGWAHLGHGGRDSDGSHSGDITITGGEFAVGATLADGRDVSGEGFYARAGNFIDSYVQVGHGGNHSRGFGTGADAVGQSGDISMIVDGNIKFIAGSYTNDGGLFTNEDGRASALLGHGGYDADVSSNGSTDVRGLNNTVTGLPVGHHGDITVVANDGSISFLAGDINRTFEPSVGGGRGNYHFAQLGHGGANSHGNHYGGIEVRAGVARDGTLGASADGDILFASGGATDNEWADNGNYAQLGHGGRGSQGNLGLRDVDGDPLETFNVMAGRDLTFTAENGGPSSYVMLGSGGHGARGDHVANINVFAERDIKIAGGNRFTGVPNPGEGYYVSYGQGSRTDGNNATINQDHAANLGSGANFNLMYTRVVPGTLSIAIRLDDGTIVGYLADPEGDGTLNPTADITADFGTGTETILASEVVGNVSYSEEGTSTVTFLRDMNPGMTASPNTANPNPGDAGTVNLWITFETGDHDLTWAQIGNGGYESDNGNNVVDNGHRGSITVAARTGMVSLESGTEDGSYTQIGNGGYGTKGHNTGDIHVRAGLDVNLTAGLDRGQNHAQIGHGGWDADGNQSGVIKVSAGTGDLFTSLGTGKFDDMGDFDGDGNGDEIQFASSALGGISLKGGATENNAQIGHGGRSAVDGNVTTLDGVIAVSATGDIELLAGAGSRAYTQIGHGGWNENQTVNITGDIHVISEKGDLMVDAGTGSESYALIGHGDDQNNDTTNLGGDRTGGIQVVANKITLDTSGSETAWIGHSFDRTANNNNPFAAANLDLSTIVGNYTPTGVGYQVIALDGFEVLNDGAATTRGDNITFTDAFRDNFITPNLALGNFAYSAKNITVNTQLDYSNAFAAGNGTAQANQFNLLASGDIDVNYSIQNPGSGDINLVAGVGNALGNSAIVDGPSRLTGEFYSQVNHLYCPPTAFMDILSIKADGSMFGNDNGTTLGGAGLDHANGQVSINASSRAIAVGSRLGMTNVLGYSVEVLAGNTGSSTSIESAQIGFRTLDVIGGTNQDGTDARFDAAFGDATGDIMVHAKEGGINLVGGTGGSTYAQIGHGGYDNSDTLPDMDPTLKGMISVDASFGAVDGNVTVQAGIDPSEGSAGFSSDRQFAIIGHGGFDLDGDHGGVNAVTGAGVPGLVNALAGGNATVLITPAGVIPSSLSLTVGLNTITDNGSGVLTHSTAGVVGSIDYATGIATFTANANPDGDTMATASYSKDSSIVVKGADVLVQGGGNNVGTDDHFAQIGHGGRASEGDLGGAITVAASGTLDILAGAGDRSYAQIGHGGDGSVGTKDGVITVSSGGDLTMRGTSGVADGAPNFPFATGVEGYVQIGHGGREASGNATGSVLVSSAGSISGVAGDRTNAYLQIGHGGAGARGDFGQEILGVRDQISVTAANDIVISGGNNGEADGGVDGRYAYALIGHGGRDADNPNPGDPGYTAPPTALERVGNTADITVTSATGDITFTTGSQREAFTQLGHGGSLTDGDHVGNILVSAVAGGITFDGSSVAGVDSDASSSETPQHRYAQLGHGGYLASGGHTGTIGVTAGGPISFSGGDESNNYAQLGHGGRNDDRQNSGGNNYNDRYFSGTHSGQIDVTTTAGDITFTAGDGDTSYGKLGHGGYASAALQAGEGHNGAINVTSEAGAVNFAAGVANQAFVQLGHGGHTSYGDHNGAITVTSLTGVDFKAGQTTNLGVDGDQAFAQVGHGGYDSSFEARDVQPQGAASAYHINTPVGDAIGTTGAITVRAGVDAAGAVLAGGAGASIKFTSGNDGNAYAQLGNGGASTRGGHTGAIIALAADEVKFDASSVTKVAAAGSPNANSSYVQLGHGGISARADASTRAGHDGDITVSAGAGGVSFIGGDQNDNYAQLGHGGRAALGDHSGDITLDSVGTIALTGGDDMRSYAMIGNGGHNADDTATDLGNTGFIKINQTAGLVQTAGAAINLTSGGGEESFVQIGHGGTSNSGNHSSTAFEITTRGDLTVKAGDGSGFGDDGGGGEIIENGRKAYAQIGHGGYTASAATGGGHAGDICINIDGSLDMSVEGGGNKNLGGYMQIGHGGRASDGDHNGKLTVVTGVRTANGAGINMRGGLGSNQSVQIGHGGRDVDGALSGRIFVVADNSGDLNMRGGNGYSWVQIGHGDGAGDYGNFGSGSSTGTREGGLQIFVGGATEARVTNQNNANVHLLHRTQTDGSGGTTGLKNNANSYLGGDGYQYVTNGGTTVIGANAPAPGGLTETVLENVGEIAAGNIGGGNVVMTLSGNNTINLPTDPTTQYKDDIFSFIVLSTGNLNFNRSIQNAGEGTVALVAGWNGVQDPSSMDYLNEVSVIDFCDPEIIPGAADFNDCDTFGVVAGQTVPMGGLGGQSQGILTVGSSTQTEAVRVGSRLGQTILRGRQINILSGSGANAATQIGFYGTGVNASGLSGVIDIQAKGDVNVAGTDFSGGLNMTAGTGAGAYVQVGHGGAGGGTGAGPTGAGTAPADPTGIINGLINISFCEPAAINISGGNTGAGAYAQIGHGISDDTVIGEFAGGGRNGDISVTNFTSLSLNGGSGASNTFAQIGHGGADESGDKSGLITITGTSTPVLQGDLTMTSGAAGAGGYTQIGHGGGAGSLLGGQVGAIDTASAVSVANVKAIGMTAGAYGAYSQIGNGGLGYQGAIGGDVNVAASGDITMTSGSGDFAHTLIGLGGSTLGGVVLDAEIDVQTSGGGIALNSGSGDYAYSQVGIGGSLNSGTVNTDNFVVSALNDIVLTSNGGRAAHTMIGLGGDRVIGTKTGNISVTSTDGGVQLNSSSALDSYSMIGVGGQEGSDGSISGNVTVQSDTDITLMSGSGENAFTMIGQGGNGVTGTKTGQVTVTSDNGGLSMTAGTPATTENDSFSMIGAGGHADSSGAITTGVKVDVANNIAMTSGASLKGFTMIGIGGRDSNGDHNANIDVDAGGTLTMVGGTNTDAFSMIGIGGYSATGNLGSATTTVDVMTGGAIDMDAGGGTRAFVQIGVGGSDSDGVHDGLVTVNSGGAFSMDGGGSNAYGMIGIGGEDADSTTLGSATTKINLIADGNIDITGGTGADSFVQVGVGGEDADADAIGDIKVESLNGWVNVKAGPGTNGAYAQIGNGGHRVTGDANGFIDIDAATSFSLHGGAGSQRNFALVGNGGIESRGAYGDADDTISVNAGTFVDILGGDSHNSFAQIGHGGLAWSGTVSMMADIDVTAGTNITLTGGLNSSEDDSWAMIGHGGNDPDAATINGDVRVDARNGTLKLESGNGSTDTGNFTQVGHGGPLTEGAMDGRIVVLANAIDMDSGGMADAYAQIGHGGFDTDNALGGTLSGDIFINVDPTAGNAVVGGGGNITLNSSGLSDAYTQIGHGGSERVANLSGDITIGKAADIVLKGGGTRAYSQIGHGGGTPGSTEASTKSGSITITESNNITVEGGTGSDSYGQIGHGGNENLGNTNGDILITTAGELDITGGSSTDAYAQVGHGGHLANGDHGVAADEIRILAGALDLNATAGGSGGAYAQLGHGGYNTDGILTSDIFVNFNELTLTPIIPAVPGTLTMHSASADNAYTQIGHGGANSGTETNSKDGDILIGGFTSVAMNGGDGAADAYSQIGHGGDENRGDAGGVVAVATTGAVTMAAGDGSDAYVQIGHGGHDASGALGTAGDVTAVSALGGVDMDGGSTRSYAQIGAGGFNADGTIIGHTFVNVHPITMDVAGAGAITMNSGSGTGAYTQIGIGGEDSDADKTGDVNVLGDSFVLAAGGGDAYSQIGAGGGLIGGGSLPSGDITSNTTVTATTGSISLDSSTATGQQAYTQIGGGGLIHDGLMSGFTTVTASLGDVELKGGANSNNYSMIGLGGTGSGNAATPVANLTGANTTVTAVNVTMISGDGPSAYTKIGSGGGASGGGNSFVGTIEGTTTVTASGAVSLTSGANSATRGSFSQIGIGGLGADASTMTGDTLVTFGNGLSLNASNGGENAYVQIGAGGQDADGTITSNTRATGTGAIVLMSGTSGNAYSQIGLGGAASDGVRTGNVLVGGDSLVMSAGSGGNRNYSQIGNKSGAAGTSGFVTANIGGAITMTGGGGSESAAQIGHSIENASETINGTISIVAGGDIGINGGTDVTSGAIIGHGDTDGSAPGTRTGGLNVYTDGSITLSDGTTGAALIAHQTGDGAGSVDYAAGTSGGDNGFSLVGLSGINMASILRQQTGNGGTLITLAETIGAATSTDDVLIASGGAGVLTIGDGAQANVSFSSMNHVNLLSGGNLSILTGLQNAGSGNMNLLGGWANTGSTMAMMPDMTMSGVFDATSSDFQTVSLPDFQSIAVAAMPAAAEFGANSGQVLIGDGSQSAGIAVGTAGGLSQVAGYGVVIQGGNTSANASAQIGFNNGDSTSTTGSINVTTHDNGLSVLGGTGIGAFAQVGDGGSGGTSNLDGSITIDLTAGTVDGVLQVTAGGDQSYAQIGNGGLGAGGTKGGDVTVTANAVTIQGGSGSDAYSRIGNGGSRGSGDIAGSVGVTSTMGDVSVVGGVDDFTEAAIGNGGTSYNAVNFTGGTTVTSAANVVGTAGDGVQASVQIGSGGIEVNISSLINAVSVTAVNDISLTGGSDIRSYSQIGNGGATANGSMSGAIDVIAGNDIIMVATAGDKGAYTKIGHGDDLYSPTSSIDALGGSGAREGDITVTAGSDIASADSMIGHVNHVSSAVALGGVTQIAASANAVTDPSGGSIIADENSEFTGVDELRFYVAERSSNDIQADALLNGEAFIGAETDPSILQRDDEFTVNITGVAPSMPGEHGNAINTGPSPTNAASFAFYYNSIELTNPPVVIPGGSEGGGSGDGGADVDGEGSAGGGSDRTFLSVAEARELYPEDKLLEEWQRENEGLFTGFSPFGMFFVGFDHYDVNGNPTFHFVFANELDSSLITPPEFEDVLESQEQILEEEEEGAE
ncbi:filamentous hemagglutinin N-terminal domain-containing protein [Verrucomicrobiales bacterium BCK34]|nr:filamentous hemagglutinin N-terminal domain-containing protein [Verrucomicrobiales bacterium BCK34]